MKHRAFIEELVTFIAIGVAIGFTLALVIEYRRDFKLLLELIHHYVSE